MHARMYVIRDASMNASPPRLFPVRVLYIDPSGDRANKREYITFTHSLAFPLIRPLRMYPRSEDNSDLEAISVRDTFFLSFFFIQNLSHRLNIKL